MLEGFEKFEVSPGSASISVTSYGVGFSKSAVLRMSRCEYVISLIDYSGKRFAIQKCGKDDDGSTKFYHGQRNTSVRWNNKELIKTLKTMMGWDLSKKAYKVDGEYIPNEQALIFDLNNAETINRGN